jgi:hypothetical protein
MAISNILRTFGIFYDHLVHTYMTIWYVVFQFWYHGPRKIWQPWFRAQLKEEDVNTR